LGIPENQSGSTGLHNFYNSYSTSDQPDVINIIHQMYTVMLTLDKVKQEKTVGKICQNNEFNKLLSGVLLYKQQSGVLLYKQQVSHNTQHYIKNI